MADRSTRLIHEALTRAAAEPGGLPLFAGRGGPGLFPASAAARHAAQRCRDDGLLDTRADGVGKSARELAVITDKGRTWLAARSDSRQVLEDFLRVLEEKQAQVADLVAAARHMASGLEGLRGAIERLAPDQAHHVAPAQKSDPIDDAPSLLHEWHCAASGDCPLPELFRRLEVRHPGITIGRFHDILRRLHDESRIYLHPWTGPLYELPEPRYALLAGHLVAYYASPK